MLSLTSATRVLVATTPVDLRGSFNRLYSLVVEQLKADPLSGHLFVFTNGRRNRIKVLYWDGDGLWVCAKRLEQGRFTWPVSESGHARRAMHEALAETKLAAWFVGQIGQLYAVERKLREQKAGPQLRAAMRVWQSRPVLERLRRAMELIRRKTLPQGLLGQAIDYTLKRWEALNRFVEDGFLEIDNNLIENLIRPSALGKRNWLFIGHPEAGERSAVVYTLLGSCRRQGINPFEYLKDLFTRLPAAKITEINEFTPSAWARAKVKQVVPLAA